MSIKNTLRKAAGLFVEISDAPASDDFDPNSLLDSPAPAPAPASKTVEQLVKETPGPNLSEIKVEPAKVQAPTVSAPGGAVKFAEIYAQANVPVASFTAEQALEMINSLPGDLPIEVRRKTISVTMETMGKATGVNVETVVADASRKLAALDSYADALSTKTADFVAVTNMQIAAMENEITEKRRLIDDTKRLLQVAVGACESEADRLDDILEFFSLDVAPSSLSGKQP
ncbi:MAG: hypothetical protein ABL949_03140 [Fimbriimonadaceae bacterium]